MNLILSMLMLAGIAMTVGAVLLIRRSGFGKQPLLMATTALVMFANVAILVWPA